MNLKFLAAASVVALSATSAQAVSISTFDGGDHGSFQAAIEAPIAGSFFKAYEFTLGGTFDVTTTFASSGIVGAFGLYKWDDTPVAGATWGVGGPSFSASGTTTLGAGSYYYAVMGMGKPGSYTLTSTAVAAVPEPETYALLGAGLGIIGFVASRRRRND